MPPENQQNTTANERLDRNPSKELVNEGKEIKLATPLTTREEKTSDEEAYISLITTLALMYRVRTSRMSSIVPMGRL